MKEVTAYQTSDGKYFEWENQARKYQDDIIGELLDTLLPHDDRGNVTMSDRHNLLMKMLTSKDTPVIITKLKEAYDHE